MRYSIYFAALLACLSGCSDQMKQENRPPNIPPGAVWAGGADGGSWIACNSTGSTNQYNCIIFKETTGEIYAQGRFVLRSYIWNEEKKRADYDAADPIKELHFRSYDGKNIFLENSLILLPDGVVDYPLGKSHGKRQEYKSGTPIGIEIEY